jgi:hypothetical protein
MDRQDRTEDIRNKPVGEMVDDVMQQSQQVLQAGARVTAEVNELKRRADEALDWRKQLDRHPWVLLGSAVGAAVLLFWVFSRKS